MADLKKLLVLFLSIILVYLSTQTINAQEVKKLRSTVSAGGSSKTVTSQGKQYIVQQSIGQPGVIGLYQTNGFLLRQGFIQPLQGAKQGFSSKNLQMNISPNPFSTDITLSFADNIYDYLFVTLFDMVGNTVYFEKYGAAQKINLHAGDLASGPYILRVHTNKKYYVVKLIKE